MASVDSTVPVVLLLRVMRREWRRLTLLVVGAVLVGVIAAAVLPRRYEAGLVALPRGSDRNALLNSLTGQLGGLAALAGLGGGEGGQRAEAIQMLQSQILAREFIEDKQLLPVLFASDWDADRKAWRGRVRTLNDGVDYFDHRIRTVVEDRRTGLVTLRITWRDPHQAAEWANELVRRANDRLRQRAITRSQGSIDYLKKEARNTDVVEIQQSLYRLMEDQYKSLLLANVTEDYAFSVIDPAFASDPRGYVFPRMGLFAFGGLFFGIVLALIVAFVEAARGAEPQDGSQRR